MFISLCIVGPDDPRVVIALIREWGLSLSLSSCNRKLFFCCVSRGTVALKRDACI